MKVETNYYITCLYYKTKINDSFLAGLLVILGKRIADEAMEIDKYAFITQNCLL